MNYLKKKLKNALNKKKIYYVFWASPSALSYELEISFFVTSTYLIFLSKV